MGGVQTGAQPLVRRGVDDPIGSARSSISGTNSATSPGPSSKRRTKNRGSDTGWKELIRGVTFAFFEPADRDDDLRPGAYEVLLGYLSDAEARRREQLAAHADQVAGLQAVFRDERTAVLIAGALRGRDIKATDTLVRTF